MQKGFAKLQKVFATLQEAFADLQEAFAKLQKVFADLQKDVATLQNEQFNVSIQMKVDVLIEYDKKSSEVTFSSKAAQFIQNRPARIGLSYYPDDDSGSETIEFVGESWEIIKNIESNFDKDPTRENRILRIVNPFEPATFESKALFLMIDHLSMYITAVFYPKTWMWRKKISLLAKYEISLKIPDYSFFNPQRKSEFEKLLYANYKNSAFIN